MHNIMEQSSKIINTRMFNYFYLSYGDFILFLFFKHRLWECGTVPIQDPVTPFLGSSRPWESPANSLLEAFDPQ
jgi:hypothetical protein